MHDKSLIDSLFEKAKTKITDVVSLDEITQDSFYQFYNKVDSALSYTESEMLYQAANQISQEKFALARKHLARGNPQLRQARSLDIQPEEISTPVESSHLAKRAVNETEEKRGDEQILLNRDALYVPAGHVASKFSPAAYLAELYREAGHLHDDENVRALKKRRPDLANLVLSQDNLDKEVSTLSLSNALLLQGCQAQTSELSSKEKVLAHLATHRLSVETPYHHAFQTLRHSVQQGKMTPEAILAAYAEIAPNNKTIEQSHMGIFTNIDPELYQLLTEEVTTENAGESFKKNFGVECTPNASLTQESTENHSTVLKKADLCRWLLNTHNLANYYNTSVNIVEQIIQLNTVTVRDNDLYHNDKHNFVIQSNAKLLPINMIRTRYPSYDNTLYYAFLLPSFNSTYELVIKPRASIFPQKNYDGLSIYQTATKELVEMIDKKHAIYENPIYGGTNETEIRIKNININNGKIFSFFRYNNKDKPRYAGIESYVHFDFIKNPEVALLKLNKIFRLSKAMSLTPTEIELIILAHNTEMNVENSVIASLFGIVRYQQRYNLATEEAVILCGASLSQHTIGETRSQFDRLFNQVSAAENTLVPNDQLEINLRPDNNDNQDWKSALKQAFQVNDTELLAMVGSETLEPTLFNLSRLYFIHLLGRIHHLTASQTMTLLNILGYHTRSTVVQSIYQTTQWLKEEALTVEQLFLMTTTTYSSLSTPEMMTLAQTLQTSLPDKSKTDDKSLYTSMSQIVATALGINNLSVTENILIWMDALTPKDKLNCKQFVEDIGHKVETTIKLSDKAIDFCQRLSQIALIVQWLKLDELVMTLIANYPKKVMSDDVASIPRTPRAFRQLSRLRDFLSQCGQSSLAVAAALIEGKLTLDLLASAIGEEKQTLEQAAGQLDKENTISHFSKINKILHILFLSKSLRVSPQVVKSLQKITYESNYADIQQLADSLLAGLDTSARQSVNDALEESLSAALSSYYIRTILPQKGVSWVNNRDELYQYLLIDNQVSGDVKTSRIAQAISSIQLYVDNCLSEPEENASTAGYARDFFIDWERCNKRYSQWAAAKRLLYYPENYLDPTQRVGQTGMMDRLLQSISQSQLNNDTVEDAFKNYLTDVEQIANLSIVSGYHDDIDAQKGLTYLIGVSQTEPKEYYWRSVNHNKFRENKFPASAWSEWKKIDTTLKPIGNLIRPIMYFSRLYILWVEQHQEGNNNKETQSEGQSQKPNSTIIYSHNLKLAYLRHDGTWSTPFIFPLKNELSAYHEDITKLSLSCTHCEDDPNLTVIIYEIRDSYNKEDSIKIGLSISSNMKYTFLLNKEKKQHFNSISNTLDTSNLVKIDNKQKLDIKGYTFLLEENEHSVLILDGVQIKVNIKETFLTINVNVNVNVNVNLLVPAQSTVLLHNKTNINEYKTIKVTVNINNKEAGVVDILDDIMSRLPTKDIPTKIINQKFNLPYLSDTKKTKLTITRHIEKKNHEITNDIVIDDFTIGEIKPQVPENIVSIKVTEEGNQYLKLTEGRLAQLNTLFAKKLVERAGSGIESILNLETQKLIDATERLDFTGPNALYLWEIFYYAPMMVTRRLLQEQQFDEAARWLKYIYSPSGYWVQGKHDPRCWNVRPLLEDTGWDLIPSDMTDPDAVAQHDPMHYKLATFMCQLDLLIAHGDAAYRMLERDTLVEAMIWYRQALNLLGPLNTSQQQSHNLPNLTLQAVANKKDSDLATVLLPEENTKLTDYRKTLELRIYNLRHNLNIDGQPLFLPLYAKPANPQNLRSALVASTGSSPVLPKPVFSLYRFPLMLERARSMVNQLTQFGNLLSSILERQDAEGLNQLLQNQAKALFMMSVGIQNHTLEELAAERDVLMQQQAGARQRLEHYQGLYEENINAGENNAMAARLSAGQKALTATGLHMVAAGLDSAPNIFGFSVGGSRWGALATAGALGANIWSSYEMNNADNTTLKESYRRRREEWDIQRKTAQTDVNQLEAQMKARDIRYEAAVMQKTYLETQQKQAQEQLGFLQRKFSNQALYSRLRGRLSAIYYQFYDLTMSCCLMAEAAYHYEVKGDPLQTPQFIKPGAWQSAHAGLLCGEALSLNLAQMEDNYLKWESRALEVTRTVCLSEMYANLTTNKFTFSTKVVELVNNGQGTAGNGDNSLKFNENQLQATLKLSDLKIKDDYPASLGEMRRIKQISVTLPALVGPYQDVRAVLSYGGSVTLPRGCRSLAVSHGMNDSGQFQLDFNDGKFLPFEGIPVNDSGVFTLSFPQATGKQKALLLSLSDIILHIRYTIRD